MIGILTNKITNRSSYLLCMTRMLFVCAVNHPFECESCQILTRDVDGNLSDSLGRKPPALGTWRVGVKCVQGGDWVRIKHMSWVSDGFINHLLQRCPRSYPAGVMAGWYTAVGFVLLYVMQVGSIGLLAC